jgi:ribosome biogenesis protein ERB1
VSKKRKELVEVESGSEDEQQLGLSMDMLSEDEAQDAEPPGDESDEEAEPFPEIDPASSSEEDSEDEPDREEESSESESGRSSALIPLGGKVVTSEITGQPKRIYNPIEPDYDSDSSTEDVSVFPHFSLLSS